MKSDPSLRPQPGKEHEYRTHLGDGFQLVVRYRMERGKVAQFAVVLLREIDGKGPQQICRYDNAHGFAHLDILNRSGNLRQKLRIPNMPEKKAFEYAIADLKTNYQAYWDDFISS